MLSRYPSYPRSVLSHAWYRISSPTQFHTAPICQDDDVDYYRVLGLERGASAATIKKSVHPLIVHIMVLPALSSASLMSLDKESFILSQASIIPTTIPMTLRLPNASSKSLKHTGSWGFRKNVNGTTGKQEVRQTNKLSVEGLIRARRLSAQGRPVA
jgi:hypothetical protein